MPDHAAPPPPSTGDHAAKADENLRQPASSTKSILGMALVSAINIGCVVFIAFHYTTHANEPGPTVEIKLPPGNVSLETSAFNFLAIASNTAQASPHNPGMAVATELPEPGMTPSSTEDEPAPDPEMTAANEEQHWVQLGALSKIATARSYWSRLQKSHTDLLNAHQPSFVGPDQVGGSLFHIRVGPLAAEQAAGLCSDLQQAGTDCFCIAADGDELEHRSSEK